MINDNVNSEKKVSMKKSFAKRTFSKLTEGGIRSSILNMVMTSCGASLFTLPYFTKHLGLVFMIVFVGFSAFNSYFSSAIIKEIFKHKKSKSYIDLIYNTLGFKMSIFSTVILIVHLFGSICSTWIFSYKFLNNSLINLNILSSESNVLYVLFFIISGILSFLMTIAKNVDKIKYISFLGFGFLFYIIIVIIFQSEGYYKEYKADITLITYKWSRKIGKAFGVANYIYLNHFAIVPMCSNLTNNKGKRLTKVILRTSIILTVIYVLILIFGFLSIPNTNNQQFEFFPLRPKIKENGDKDIVMSLGLLGYAIVLFISVLLRIFYCKDIIKSLHLQIKYQLNKDKENNLLEINNENNTANSESDYSANYVSLEDKLKKFQNEPKVVVYSRNIILILLLIIVAITTSNYVTLFLGLVGSLIAMFENILIPSYALLTINKNKIILNNNNRNILKLYMGLFSIISFGMFILTLLSVLEN